MKSGILSAIKKYGPLLYDIQCIRYLKIRYNICKHTSILADL